MNIFTVCLVYIAYMIKTKMQMVIH